MTITVTSSLSFLERNIGPAVHSGSKILVVKGYCHLKIHFNFL